MTTTRKQARCPGSDATSGFRQAYPGSMDPAEGVDWRSLYMCPECTARRRPLRDRLQFPVHTPRRRPA